MPSWVISGLSLLPACAVCLPVCVRPSCTSWSLRYSRSVSGRGLDDAPPWWATTPPPQRPSLGSGLYCPGPSSLNRPHPPHSQAHRNFTAWRLIRDAFAVRERRGDPRVVPGFHCTFLPGMPSSPTPGESDIDIFQNFDADIGLRRMTTGSALPTLPQSVPRGRSISWLHWFASATACQVACPPVRIRLGYSPATGDFYFQAFNGSVSLPVAGYNYNSDWTPLLAGLSPAGMAASFAARSFTTDAFSSRADQCPLRHYCSAQRSDA